MKSWTYRLSHDDLRLATAEAEARVLRNANKQNTYGFGEKVLDGRHMDMELMGTRSELACARLTGLPWDTAPRSGKRPDVGHLHVRSTAFSSGHLLIHEDDLPGIYVLLVGAYRDWRAVGCVCWPDDKSRAVWAKNNPERPCWWIAQKDLRKMDECFGVRDILAFAAPAKNLLDTLPTSRQS